MLDHVDAHCAAVASWHVARCAGSASDMQGRIGRYQVPVWIPNLVTPHVQAPGAACAVANLGHCMQIHQLQAHHAAVAAGLLPEVLSSTDSDSPTRAD